MHAHSEDFKQIEYHSPLITQEYMKKAVDIIDAMFGLGYAKKNPQLLGDFMKTAAIEKHAMIIKIIGDDHYEFTRETEKPQKD